MTQSRTPLVIVIIWIIFMLWLFFPGYMSTDSYVQLMQGRGVYAYEDAHPIIMARLWGFLDSLITGSFLMLIIQLIIFASGLYFFVQLYLVPPLLQALAFFIIAFNPAVFSIVGIVWKDVWAVGFFLWGMFFLCLFMTKEDKADYKPIAWALICLTLGALFRLNAFGGSVAAAVMIAIYFLLLGKWSFKKRVIAFLTVLILVPALFLIGKKVVKFNIDVKEKHHETITMGFDLVGMSVVANRRLIEDGYKEFIDDDVSIDDLRKCFQSRNVVRLYRRKSCDKKMLSKTGLKSELIKIKKNWLSAIGENPISWIKHKMRFSRHLLGLDELGVGGAILAVPHTGEARKIPIVWDTEGRKTIRSLIVKYCDITHMPALYLMLAVVLVVFLLARLFRFGSFDQPFSLLTVLLTGLAYQGTILLGATAADYRYSHLMIFFTFMSFVIIVLQAVNQCAFEPPGGLVVKSKILTRLRRMNFLT